MSFVTSITLDAGSVTGLTLRNLADADLPIVFASPGEYRYVTIRIDQYGRAVSCSGDGTLLYANGVHLTDANSLLRYPHGGALAIVSTTVFGGGTGHALVNPRAELLSDSNGYLYLDASLLDCAVTPGLVGQVLTRVPQGSGTLPPGKTVPVLWAYPEANSIQGLTDSSTITWNQQGIDHASATLSGGTTRLLMNPFNMTPGVHYLTLIQSSGNDSVTYDSLYDFGALGTPTLSTSAGALDVLAFFSDGVKMYGAAYYGFAVPTTPANGLITDLGAFFVDNLGDYLVYT